MLRASLNLDHHLLLLPKMVHNAPSPASSAKTESLGTSEGFRAPNKRILTPDQLTTFQQSATHTDIIAFVTRLNGSIKGAKLSDKLEGEEHPVCPTRFLRVLALIWTW
jgi:serine/threonine-protein phosphatase 2A activator